MHMRIGVLSHHCEGEGDWIEIQKSVSVFTEQGHLHAANVVQLTRVSSFPLISFDAYH